MGILLRNMWGSHAFFRIKVIFGTSLDASHMCNKILVPELFLNIQLFTTKKFIEEHTCKYFSIHRHTNKLISIIMWDKLKFEPSQPITLQIVLLTSSDTLIHFYWWLCLVIDYLGTCFYKLQFNDLLQCKTWEISAI